MRDRDRLTLSISLSLSLCRHGPRWGRLYGRPCWFVYLDHTRQAAPFGCSTRRRNTSLPYLRINRTRNYPSPSPLSILEILYILEGHVGLSEVTEEIHISQSAEINVKISTLVWFAVCFSSMIQKSEVVYILLFPFSLGYLCLVYCVPSSVCGGLDFYFGFIYSFIV